MIAVDVNVLAYLHLRGPMQSITERLFQKDSVWVAPHLWRSEFRNILLGYLRGGKLSRAAAEETALQAESFMSQREYPVASAKVLQLAEDSGCSAYDCEYVAVAQQLQVSLVTEDKKLLHGFPKVAVSIAEFVRS